MKKRITPLERWISAKIGLGTDQPLDSTALARYRLTKLQQTIAHARQKSLFYRDLFKSLPDPAIEHIEEVATLPLTTSAALRQDPLALLCVSQDEIARVVTLHSSGTSGPPKRLFFSDQELDLTVDFFHHGLPLLIRPGQRALILMPGKTPGSIGDLLVQAMNRMHAKAFVHGLVHDPELVVRQIRELKINCLIGIPVQVLAVAEQSNANRQGPDTIQSVLLSTDYVASSLAHRIRQIWNCEVFEHYGMTEMGYGCGVDCAVHEGYHLRENDLYIEIVDPNSGTPLPPGASGEVVFTTLTRTAMPLVRYRTGDIGRMLADPCPCGSRLERLDKIQGRIDAGIHLNRSLTITLPLLAETIFGVAQVKNFWPEISLKNGQTHLRISIQADPHHLPQAFAAVRKRLLTVASIRSAVTARTLTVAIDTRSDPPPKPIGFEKKVLVDTRNQ